MSEAIELLAKVAAVSFPFIMMPLLWRRMKRVQHETAAAPPRERPTQPWEETLVRQDGIAQTKRESPNDELIGLGARARHGRWHFDNF